MSSKLVARCAVILSAPDMRLARAQEAGLEEVRVEGSFDLKLEPPRQSAVQTLLDRLTLRADRNVPSICKSRTARLFRRCSI